MLRDDDLQDTDVTERLFSVGPTYTDHVARVKLSNAGVGCLILAIIFGALPLILIVVLIVVALVLGEPDPDHFGS
jgi:hypothetical protein